MREIGEICRSKPDQKFFTARLRGEGVTVRSEVSVHGRLGGQTHPHLDRLQRNCAGIAVEGAELQEILPPDKNFDLLEVGSIF